jgi:hypothetical protein
MKYKYSIPQLYGKREKITLLKIEKRFSINRSIQNKIEPGGT